MLRDKIDSSDGLLQIVGDAYGAEPPEEDKDFGRVSYTQFEFLYAKQQGKKTWLIMAQEGCSRDRPNDQLDFPGVMDHEDAQGYQAKRRSLQQAYRDRLQAGVHLWHDATDDKDIELKVERLRDEFAKLRRSFARWQRGVTLAVAAIVVLLALIGSATFVGQRWLKQDTEEIRRTTQETKEATEEQLAEIKAGQKVSAARIRAQLIEASEQERYEELSEAEKEPRFDERERLRELAQQAHTTRLSRIDGLATRFAEIEQRADASDEFREMTRILQDEENGVEKALAYAEKGRNARRDRIRARKLAQQERNRAELQIDLKAASVEASRGRPAAARQLFKDVLDLEPDWPELHYRLISQTSQDIGHQLPRATKLGSHSRNKNAGSDTHGSVSCSELRRAAQLLSKCKRPILSRRRVSVQFACGVSCCFD